MKHEHIADCILGTFVILKTPKNKHDCHILVYSEPLILFLIMEPLLLLGTISRATTGTHVFSDCFGDTSRGCKHQSI